MNINIQTIPHETQRYPTCGDWWFDPDGTLQIRVSKMPNDDYEQLIALHELVEVLLCKARGITGQCVDNFDMQYEKDRAAGLHDENDEPGDDIKAPYRREHFFATNIEAMMAHELDVNWQDYEKAVEALP